MGRPRTAADAQREMALFDQFGPLAREALRNVPRDAVTERFYQRFGTSPYGTERTLRDGTRVSCRIDLTEPALDARIADFIDQQLRQKLGRPIADFVLVPMRPTRERLPRGGRAYRRIRTWEESNPPATEAPTTP